MKTLAGTPANRGELGLSPRRRVADERSLVRVHRRKVDIGSFFTDRHAIGERRRQGCQGHQGDGSRQGIGALIRPPARVRSVGEVEVSIPVPREVEQPDVAAATARGTRRQLEPR